jgi:ubiquinone/menaquinone biosynthesis C-methylase UbiE
MNRYFGLHTLEGEWHALLPRYVILADRLQGKRVLDIGCGTGIGASMMLELGAEWVDAIDHRPAVLELGRMKHAKSGLDFHVMFWEELNFPDDTFDAVVCLDPSSPCTDPSLISEVQRVLKPDGEYICAIEFSNIDGLEVVLPRYGYSDGGENVSIHGSRDRVPQLGELQTQFSHVQSIIQRPLYAYVFDHHNAASAAETVRKNDESGESGVWHESSESGGRWISTETRLALHDETAANIALYFCSNAECGPPPLREVHLPYFSIVERLKQVVGDLQTAPMRHLGEDSSIFDEVVDTQEASPERHPTNEFKAVSRWEEQPTTIRQRPDFSALQAPVDPLVALQQQVSDLTNLYASVQHEFTQVVHQAQNALQERDHYIEHLVAKIHDWEQRLAVPAVEDSVQTGEHPRLVIPQEEASAEDAAEPALAQEPPEEQEAESTDEETT